MNCTFTAVEVILTLILLTQINSIGHYWQHLSQYYLALVINKLHCNNLSSLRIYTDNHDN